MGRQQGSGGGRPGGPRAKAPLWSILVLGSATSGRKGADSRPPQPPVVWAIAAMRGTPPPPTLDPQPPPEMSSVSSIIVEHGSAGKLMLRLILIVEPRVVSTCQGKGWVRHQGVVHLQKGEGKSMVAFKLPGGGAGG